MRLHPRTTIVQTAQGKLAAFLSDLVQEYQLTYGETFHLLGGEIANLARYQIRTERHPDTDQRGDEA